jgi:hypothetical protein
MQPDWHDEAATLWLAPLVATIPLIPIMSIRSSPFFIGRLMDDPTHPFNWPDTGPLISAAGVVFDAEILGILFVLFLIAPAYWGLRQYGKNSARNILIVCGGAGILASQIARVISHGFRQADLRALEHFHKYCGAGWYPAADWQSAWPAERNRAGRLAIGRRLTNLPHSNCENALARGLRRFWAYFAGWRPEPSLRLSRIVAWRACRSSLYRQWHCLFAWSS